MSKQINDLNKSLEEQLHLNEKQDKTDNTLKTNDKTVVGAINELFQDVDSGKQLIATAIGDSSITKDSTFDAMGTAITLLHNQITNLTNELAGKVTPTGTAVAANVLSGKTFINSTGKTVTGTMANQGAKTFTPSASKQTGAAGYYSGITVNTDSNLVAANIVSGKKIFGVTGSASKTKTASLSNTLIMDTCQGYSGSSNPYIATSLAFVMTKTLADANPAQSIPVYFNGSVRVKTAVWCDYYDCYRAQLWFTVKRNGTVIKTSQVWEAMFDNIGYDEVAVSYDITGLQVGDVINMHVNTDSSSMASRGGCYPMKIYGTLS